MKKLLFIIFIGVCSLANGQTKKDEPKMESPEERAHDQTEDMTKKLKLNDDQSLKVLDINIKYAKQQEAFFLANKDLTLPQEIMMKKIKDFKIAYDYNKDNEMKTVLDEKQYSKYLKNRDTFGSKPVSRFSDNSSITSPYGMNGYGRGGYRGY